MKIGDSGFAWLLIVGLWAGCVQQEVPREEPRRKEESTRLENGSFEAELNGIQIHFEVHGQGPPLMTLPNSWGLSLEGLRAMYEPLEERLTMVYFDPRGMGESAAVREESDMSMAAVRDDFDALRRHLGLERVHAIGWSNGAANLIYLAHAKPESLTSAIFVHGVASFTQEDAAEFGARFPELVARYESFQKEMMDGALAVEEKTSRLRTLWLEEFFPLMVADSEGATPLLERVFGEAQFSWRHAEYANQETSMFDARELLAGVSMPSLVIAGAHDMSPVSKAQELSDGLVDSTLKVFEYSGHFVPVEEPDAFKRAVWSFLGVD